MANFPKNEPEIIALTQSVKAGFEAHPTLFPEPPVPTLELTGAQTALQLVMDQVTAARAASEAATQAKIAALENLVTLLKKDLRYAEDAVDGDDAKLKLIGWDARKEPSPLGARVRRTDWSSFRRAKAGSNSSGSRRSTAENPRSIACSVSFEAPARGKILL